MPHVLVIVEFRRSASMSARRATMVWRIWSMPDFKAASVSHFFAEVGLVSRVFRHGRGHGQWCSEPPGLGEQGQRPT